MPDSSADRDPLDRLAEEFVARFRRGERPSLTEYADRLPGREDEVRDLFPALVEMEQLKPVSADHTGAFEPTADSGIPTLLGDFRILRQIGRGGMGVVYEAVQESLGRHVALKLLPIDALADPRQLERFRREAKSAARLHHTNIVPVFGVGEADGRHFYAMQFIAGHPLDAVLDELRRLREKAPTTTPPQRPVSAVAAAMMTGTFAQVALSESPGPEVEPTTAPLTQPEAAAPPSSGPSAFSGSLSDDGRHYWGTVARIGSQVADALAYAHGQGVLHRDIKPANLLLDLRGTVWVTDFGLAKSTDADDLTHAGDVVGTLRYMAPERFDGSGDHRADVYALGLTLYELLTLKPAFAAENRAKLVEQVVAASPPKPRSVNPAIPRDLETIVLKAIVRDPAMRYQSASELADDLRRFTEDRPILARRASSTEQAWRWCRRNPAVAGLIAAVILVFAAGATVASFFAVEAEKNEQEARQSADLALKNSRSAEANAKKAEEESNAKAYIVGRLEGREDHLRWELTKAAITTVSLQTDLDLAEIKTDPRIGLLRLTRTMKSLCSINLSFLQNSLFDDGEKLSPLHRSLREFITAAVLTTGQNYAQLLSPITHDGQVVTKVQVSSDGRRVLTQGTDGSTRLWDARTAKPIGILRTADEDVANCGFSPDGQTVFTDDRKSVARFWDAANGQLRAVTASRPNRYDAPANFGNLQNSQRTSAVIQGNRLLTNRYALTNPALIDSDGNISAVGPVELWDSANGHLVARLDGPGCNPARFKFLGGGRWVTTTQGAATVLILSAEDGRLLARLNHPPGSVVQDVDASPSSKRIATVVTTEVGYSGTVYIWDGAFSSAEPIKMYTNCNVPNDIKFLTDNIFLLSNHDIFGGSENSYVYKYGQNKPIESLYSYPDLRPAVGEVIHRGNGQVLDARNWQRLRPPDGKKYHPALASFARDGRFVDAFLNLAEINVLIDSKTEKHFPIPNKSVASITGVGLVTVTDGDRPEIRLIPTAHLDLPPDLLQLWAQVAVRGELGPEREFVKWDEPTWEKRRQELAAIPPPYPDFPFPGYVATDKLHWLRAEYESAAEKDKLPLATELLRRAEESGDRAEAVRWRVERAKYVREVAPLPRVKK